MNTISTRDSINGINHTFSLVNREQRQEGKTFLGPLELGKTTQLEMARPILPPKTLHYINPGKKLQQGARINGRVPRIQGFLAPLELGRAKQLELAKPTPTN